jgi:serine/threonine protein kinase
MPPGGLGARWHPCSAGRNGMAAEQFEEETTLGPTDPSSELFEVRSASKLSRLSVTRRLGRGAFGCVEACYSMEDGPCAVKRVRVSDERLLKTIREVDVLQRIRLDPHPHLLHMIDAWLEKGDRSEDAAEDDQSSEEEQEAGEGGDQSDGKEGEEAADPMAMTCASSELSSAWGSSQSSDSSSLCSQSDGASEIRLLSGGGVYNMQMHMLCIQTELCPQGSLHDWLYPIFADLSLYYQNACSERIQIGIFVQVVNATAHLHTLGIVHRDLKPAVTCFVLHASLSSTQCPVIDTKSDGTNVSRIYS